MKGLLGTAVVAAVLACSGSPMQAQSVSITIRVVNRTDLVLTITPDVEAVFTGDTVAFQAVAVDTLTGDTIAVNVSWSSDSPEVVIDPETGVARFLGAGSVVITATVEGIADRLIVVLREDGDGGWSEVWSVEREPHYLATGVFPDSLKLDLGELVQLCAYLLLDGEPQWKSGAICPDDAFGHTGSLPVEDVIQLRVMVEALNTTG